jgi:hypothetical protein
MRRVLPFFFVLAILCVGCAEKQAQVAVQSSLTGLAHGVQASSEIVAERMPTAAEEARQAMLAERRACAESEAPGPDCHPPGDIAAWMANYESRLSVWNDGILALRGVQESLFIGQAALTAWIESGALPASWGVFCGAIEEGVQSILSMLGVVGVDVPPALGAASNFASEACELAGPWFASIGDDS